MPWPGSSSGSPRVYLNLPFRVQGLKTYNLADIFVFFPTHLGSRKFFSSIPPAFSYHSLHLILVSLYSFNNAFFILTNQQHYSTAPGSLKFFFSLKPTALFHSSWFSNFYNHSPDFQLEIFSLSDHKPSALPHSFWFFFPFTRMYPGVLESNFYFTPVPTALPHSFWFSVKKSFPLFKYKPSALFYSFWFPKYLSQTTSTTTQLLVF